MKKIVYILWLGVLLSCNDQDAPGCLKKTGAIKTYEFSALEAFEVIHVQSPMDMELVQSNEYKVVLTTGENLINKIQVEEKEGVLSVRNDNSCNWARAYGNISLKVYMPELKRLVFESGGKITASDTLTFDELELDTGESSGDFEFALQADKLTIHSKRISNFYISGAVDSLKLDFTSGDGRFYGQNLKANHVHFYHNGTNDLMVYPIQSLSGVIDRYGNVLYYNEPVLAPDVQTLSKGRLIRK